MAANWKTFPKHFHYRENLLVEVRWIAARGNPEIETSGDGRTGRACPSELKWMSSPPAPLSNAESMGPRRNILPLGVPKWTPDWQICRRSLVQSNSALASLLGFQ
jgi:hypothetical protein